MQFSDNHLSTVISPNSLPTMASHQGVITLALALAVVLLAFPSLSYGVTLHVRPTSTNTSCLTQPCHTLSEYAQYPGRYFNESNLTLQFLPGNHTLDVNLTITKVYQLEILGNTSALVPSRVECSFAVGWVFMNITKVKVNGLEFVSCGRSQISHGNHFTTYYGLHLQSIQMTEIIDCTFQDGYGSALGIADTFLVFRGNNNFFNNCRMCSHGKCDFWGHKGLNCLGGGIYAHGSNLSFIGSSNFVDNLARDGGGIYAVSNSNVAINGNTTFTCNTAVNGGGVFLGTNADVNISGNTVFIGNLGTGLYAGASKSVDISGNTTFSHNLGGGVNIGTNSNVNISGNTTFIGNAAARNGAGEGIYTEFKCNPNIHGRISWDTTFLGRGLSVGPNSNVDISGNITFIGNSGGAVYAGSNSNMNISGNTTFRSNSAGRFGPGGGVYAEFNCHLNINGNATFIKNSVDGDGGGIYSGSHSNINMFGSTTFTDNSAGQDGGGVWSAGNINIFGNTNFISNLAGRDGGGLWSAINIKILGNANFIGNSARGDKELYSQLMGITANITFLGNSGSEDVHTHYLGEGVNNKIDLCEFGGGPYNLLDLRRLVTRINALDQHGHGGGVFIGFNANISGSTTFIANSAIDGGGFYANPDYSNVKINGNTTFIDNVAYKGGGIYSGSNRNTNFHGNITFIRNLAYYDGGGIYIRSNSNMDISGNTNFIDNSAIFGNSGGVFVGSDDTVNIKGNTNFIDNTARKDGGGISAWSNSNVSITGSITFVGNSAMVGGGLYARSNSTVNINGTVTFISNSANDGGGLYVGSSSVVKIRGNTTFIGNSALFGGCIFADSSLTLDGENSFTNCSATDGGAIYAREIQLNFSGTNVLSANKAAHFGGGLYMHKSSLNFDGDNSLTASSAGSRGGGIYATQAEINFIGIGLFSGNVAKLDGGGMYADSSSLNFSGNITIRTNTAQVGAGLYSDNNTFNIDRRSVFEGNVATYYGGGIFTRRSLLVLPGNSTFIANSAGEGGGIYATASSTLKLNSVNNFIGNRAYISGGGIWLDNSNLTLHGSNHFVGCIASYEGGAIFTYAAKLSIPGNNTFESNSATTGGGIHARWSNVSVTNSNSFKLNVAVFGGGIFTDNSTCEFNHPVTFRGNQANHTGGGIYAARSILSFLGTSFIISNHAARDGGGIYTRDDCVVNLLGLSNYRNNSAEDTGGGISVIQSSFILAGQNTFNHNHAVEGGAFYAFKSTVKIYGANKFITNSAMYGGGLTVVHSTLHLSGSAAFSRNLAVTGGGMYIADSTVDTDGSNCFTNNKAKSEGGGIYARQSLVTHRGSGMYVANLAGSKGAAIHTSFTNFIFQGSSSFVNNLAEYGGGMYSQSSNITVVHHRSNHYTPSCNNCKSVCNDYSTIPGCNFVNNTALQGGAQYFDLNSNFSLHLTSHVHFQDNHAVQFGGAIYAVDVLGPSQFLSQQHVLSFRSKCFFHILMEKQSFGLDTSPLVFVNNSARIRGSVLYGGLLEKCNFTLHGSTSGLELFNKSILQRKDYSISSDPTQLCFCNMRKLSCGQVTQPRNIYPGQSVEVSVVSIDQSGSAIATLIHTKIHSGHNLTMSETISYEIGSNCTSRNYSIAPKNLFNQLELYPSNQSESTIYLTVNITFEKCPTGFEQSNFTGECICDHRLWQYTNSCDIDRQAILRNASTTFWISISYINGTVEGFIHHHYCPFDYCTRESKHINLNNPDEQCNSNRSGMLCGKCKEGLSLVLGSSQCKYCSNSYLAVLIPFPLAGIILIILLFLLHLTVAAGTLHELIFYANIVAANHHIFFPHTSNSPASIFIAWLNLDLGIQTCFYNGLDAYAKTWLEFVFPIYIWVIVGLLVYISHHSVTATKLLGFRPVPVLATLFLLSYAKVLRTIIAALSLTILHYPHKNVVVWIHDANVSLVKYIPLVLVALLFLLFLFLPYTLLLFLGQWLQSNSHICLLSWVKNPKLKAILDTYHSPYNPQHRFWTGLFLLLRCALFLVFAFNFSGDNSVNLLVISSAILGIFVGFALLGKVYKNWYLNALEVSFILNLGILAVATYHVNQSGGSQAAVVYTSVGIAFFTFVGIVTYHIYIRIKSKVQYIQRGRQLQHENKCHVHNNNNNDNPGNLDHQPRAIPTVTEVNLHELRSPLDLLSYHQMN